MTQSGPAAVAPRRLFVFADESGDLVFSRNGSASRFFTLTTLTALDCTIGAGLQDLRRTLAWEGIGLDCEFHATEDAQAVRDRVFPVLASHRYRLDITVLEKSKAMPHLRTDRQRFYQHAWYFHFKRLAALLHGRVDEVLMISAALGTKKERTNFRSAVVDVATQLLPGIVHQVAAWQAASEPCLQAVDYCCWAVHRKWERDDARSYDLIKPRIQSEFDLFARGTTHYY